jgi:uncharacterized lipoprotein YddW (UPF0748 family)
VRTAPRAILLTVVSIAAAVVQLRQVGRAAESPSAERLMPTTADVPTEVLLRGAAQIISAQTEHDLELPAGAYAEWKPQRAPTTDAGTLSMWVKPLWPAGDRKSHVFATFRWSGSEASYFALSQGWWEPNGARKLNFVLSNQQLVGCVMPWTFDYTLYIPGEWTMLTVTWQSGNPGHIRLFVDGKVVCAHETDFEGGRHALDPVYLGSDRGAAVENRGRPSDVIIRDLVLDSRAQSADDIRGTYRRGGGTDRSKWLLAITSDATSDVTRERRVMMDEDTRWAASRLEVQRRIGRIKAAGFNVYVPCVWDGAAAYYAARSAPVSPGTRDPADPQYDPLKYLIELAHREGIEVHPWFIIARHPPGSAFPASYLAGAPDGAFNVQSAEFRDFIVALVADVAQRYDVDGINLDYVRAMGPCSSKKCLDGYTRNYGRSLSQDWELEEHGATVPSLIEWNRLAVTDIVSRISSATRKFRPKAVLTIDTIPFDHSRLHQGLDEVHWIQSGILDGLVDMAYDDPIDIDTLDRAMREFTPARQVVAVRGYDWFGDTWVDRSGNAMSDYVRLIRTRWPGAGVGFYQYPHLTSEQILALGRGVFGQSASPAWTH